MLDANASKRSISALGVAIALLASCRSGTGLDQATPAAPAPAAPAPGAPTPAAPAPAAATPGAATASGAEVWLEPVRFHGPAVWFPDELEAIDDAVAEVLARDHHRRVIDNRALHALREDAQHGRIPGAKTACAVPSIPAMVTPLTYPTAERGEVSLQCSDQGCALEVVLRAPGEGVQVGDQVRGSFAAKLPAKGTPQTWAAALRSQGLPAVPHEEPGGVTGGIIGGLAIRQSPGVHVSLTYVSHTGTWSTPLASARWSAYGARLEACTRGQPSRDWWMQPFVIEVDAAGKVTRCESGLPDRLAGPGRDCQCDVLRAIDLGRGSAGRRASFGLQTSTTPARRPSGTRRASLSRSAGDDPTASLGTGAIDGDALAACLAPIRTPLNEAVAATFAVGADGRVTRATATWPAAVPAPVATCLDRALAAGQFTCPVTGATTVTGVVDLYVEP